MTKYNNKSFSIKVLCAFSLLIGSFSSPPTLASIPLLSCEKHQNDGLQGCHLYTATPAEYYDCNRKVQSDYMSCLLSRSL